MSASAELPILKWESPHPSPFPATEGGSGGGLWPKTLGGDTNVRRPRTLGARLSHETDLDPGIQPVEVDGAAAVEEVIIAIFGSDKPESTLGDELLDGSRHFVWTSFPERNASHCRGLFERGPRLPHGLSRVRRPATSRRQG